MIQFIRLLRADFIKMKHTSMILMHIFIPLACIALFLCYYSISRYSSIAEASIYIQALAVSFPLIIGVVCSMCIEHESMAGNFKELLAVPYSKAITLLSKYFTLLILGVAAVLIATVGFYIGFSDILHKIAFDLNFYVESAFILIGSNMFIYIFHIFLSIKYGQNVSIGTGIAETFTEYLLLTGLGQKFWVLIPCAWGGKFVHAFIAFNSKATQIPANIQELHSGIILCISITLISILLACFWFCKFEGRKSRD